MSQNNPSPLETKPQPSLTELLEALDRRSQRDYGDREIPLYYHLKLFGDGSGALVDVYGIEFGVFDNPSEAMQILEASR